MNPGILQQRKTNVHFARHTVQDGTKIIVHLLQSRQKHLKNRKGRMFFCLFIADLFSFKIRKILSISGPHTICPNGTFGILSTLVV